MPKKHHETYPDINSIAVIGNYLPRKCGIATFTTDLVQALSDTSSGLNCKAMVMNDKPSGYDYPGKVRFEINEQTLTDYETAARFLNINKVDVVSLQHEFGIFGGPSGRHILKLLENIQMPVITTLHTILIEPTDQQRHIMMRLLKLSDRLVVMGKKAIDILHTVYDFPRENIVYIPHGIPDMPFVDPSYYKDRFDLLGRKVMLTFGLLSENKGIEYVLKGLPSVVERFPDLTYIILGATHPHVLETEGEKYRSKLHHIVDKLGLNENVIFENRFVSFDELCDYLAATDLYITPYNNEEQITSGTLAYASGTGKAVISTPYWHAQEILAEGRGRLVPFKDEEKMGEAIIDLFENETERHLMRKRAYDFHRDSTWEEVAHQYLHVFQQVKREYNKTPRPQHSSNQLYNQFKKKTSLPPLNLNHLVRLSDDTGLLQHADHTIAKRNHGYCTDDNARGLIVVERARTMPGTDDKLLDSLSNTYLAFLLHAYNPENGRFRNFMSYSREWKDATGSEDAHGRALWALGILASLSKSRGTHLPLTSILFMRAIEVAKSFRSLRAVAFTLMGIQYYLGAFPGDSDAHAMHEKLADRLFDEFSHNAGKDWPWPENILAYSNGKLPQALFMAGNFLQQDDMIQMALESLEWLIEIQTQNGHLTPIGNDNWYRRGGEKARFDQQPLEVNALIEACTMVYSKQGQKKWLDKAKMCFSWFLGDNDLNLPPYDIKTGGCRDGLQSDRLNQNEGAESTLAWLLSLTTMHYELYAKPTGQAREDSRRASQLSN